MQKQGDTEVSTGSNTTNSKAPSLKTTVSEARKVELQATFDKLDKSKFWVLNSTVADEHGKRLSVEERVIDFALKCNFYQ